MNRRKVLVVLVPALVVSVILSTLGVALASHWTSHGTPIREHVPSSSCKFKSLQLIYYDNNTSSSVDLEKTGQWIHNTGSCDVDAAGAYVEEGYGNRAIDFDFLNLVGADPIEPTETATLWWDLQEDTYDKSDPNNWVLSTVKAGTEGRSGAQKGWYIFFEEDGTISDYWFDG